jgi:hypothetical protein
MLMRVFLCLAAAEAQQQQQDGTEAPAAAAAAVAVPAPWWQPLPGLRQAFKTLGELRPQVWLPAC